MVIEVEKGGGLPANADKILIEKSLAGDTLAFEELVRRYETKVYTVAYRFMGNHADAADLAQEAFIRIYKSLGKFRGEAAFLTWAYHITANICRDELRKRQKEAPVVQERPEQDRILAAHQVSLEELAEQNELKGNIQKLLGNLSEDHRLILVMREIQGLAYEDIARQLECTVGTVKSRLSRARQALKEQVLAHRELFPEGLW
ncbi:MAG: sigma-70 family RNA polymerase sigma factor [Clostridia bacterium]|nr:sigma-70 family RNA polymerase sigma factor [Clostridia bacterium]